MEIFFRVILFLTGIVNLLPALLAFMPQRMEQTYGIQLPDGNYALLMRHRAVLFGIVGGLMLFSAISRQHYSLACIVGLVSMVSFIVLYYLIGPNQIHIALKKIMWTDVIASVVLIIAWVLHSLSIPKS
jgi:hypothetical protein